MDAEYYMLEVLKNLSIKDKELVIDSCIHKRLSLILSNENAYADKIIYNLNSLSDIDTINSYIFNDIRKLTNIFNKQRDL